MKKVFIIISVIFTSLCLLLVLFVVGSMAWERFSNRADDSDREYYPPAPEVAEGYANMHDDDDTDDVTDDDTDYDGNSRYAEMLEATDIEGMSPEYEQIRGAMLFAAEMFDFTEFPFIVDNGLMFFKNDDEKFETFDEYIEKYDDNGHGNTFGLLYKYAYRYYRHNDLTGLDQWVHRFRKLIRLMIPRETYIDKGFDAIVRQLLVAYDDMLIRGSFSHVYEVMTKTEWESSCDAYDKILPFVRDRRLRAFINENDEISFVERGKVNKWSVVWAYSFWARRHSENPGNLKPVADALRLLRDEVYASNSRTPNFDSANPPVEPFLTSKLRAGEAVYPWKIYTNRVEYVGINEENSNMEVLHRGEKILLNNLFWDASEPPFNRGDIIEISWCYELTCFDCDDDDMRFAVYMRHAVPVK